MSKFIEYLKLIPKGLANPKQVLEGWMTAATNELGLLSEDKMGEIIRRRAICAQCPFMSENAKAIVGYVTSREDDHCTLCSCPIIAKTSSLSSGCGAIHWNETHPTLPKLEVKWFPYESTKP